MLSREDNALVTRVGPETPLGRLMRRYWLPALLAREIAEPDGPPVRVRLLGEPLIAFRDSAGKIGLLEEFCAHRRVSLFLGRNEESGLRCIYHGWKYDVDGRCVDMPTEPPESDFRSRIRLAAYPTLELGGVVWAYLGEGAPPALPRFEWTGLRDDQRVVTRTWQECNWLQALEGGIDSMHASTLHTTLTPDTGRAGLSGLWTVPVPLSDEVEVTDYGHAYASIRPMPGGRKWVKVYHYVMPCHTFFPFELGGDGETLQPIVNGHMFVPMDDENTMVYNWIGKYGDDALTGSEREILEWSRGRAPGEVDDRHRKRRNRDVDWLIDRAVQKSETYSGIDGINNQDHAVQESMGPIVDRSKETLGTTDAAVIATRRILLARLTRAAPGEDPPGVAPTYYRLRAIERVVDAGVDWRTELRDLYDRPADGTGADG
ncbi:MAG: Rieske 2Fe-2S domain-containing protein [Defluviicoccus sp.]|nr:Rieske 2Fe-2S domain-containing protein [Defluviicoccus sp.]